VRRTLIPVGLIALLLSGVAGWLGLRRRRPQPIEAPVVQPPRKPRPAHEPLVGSGIFAAIGRFDYRFRWPILVLGLTLAFGLNVLAAINGGAFIQGGWSVPDSEARQAEELLVDRFGEQQTTMIVLYTDPDGAAAAPAFQQRIADSLTSVAEDPAVEGIFTFAATGDPGFISDDGTRTFAIIRLDKMDEEAVEDAARLSDAVEAPDGVEMIVTGVPQLYHEFNEQVERDLLQAEMISLPVALLILLAVFGSVVGAGLPIVIALLALPSTYATIRLLSGVTDMSIFVLNLAAMIGLALAIDYSLFMVSRFREELRRHPANVAVERMMATTGKAVAVSGVAVGIGLSSLMVFASPALRSMGIGGIVSVSSTLLFAMTLLPALLSMLGPRVNRLRVPLPGFLRLPDDATAAARHGKGVWAAIASRVMRRPILIAAPFLIVLLIAGTPFLRLELSTGGNLSELPPSPARTGFEVLRDEFPGGQTDPVVIAVRWPDSQLLGGGMNADRVASLGAYQDRLLAVDGVASVESVLQPPPGVDAATWSGLLTAPPEMRPAEVEAYLSDWVAGDVTRMRVFSHLLPDSAEGRALVDRLRALEAPDGALTLTSGLPSRSRDFMAAFDSAIPVAVAIVVGVTGAVLFLTFGSIFLPLKAVLMSLVSISASFGALVWIFQEGNLSGILGFDAAGTIMASTPVIMFAILFGLSMDYEVILLSRIRERFIQTGDNTRAVAEGIGLTGGVITGAALVMVAVFGAFALSSVLLIKALGFSMALAVLIDATIVRGILVPAFMRVMGSVNWWAPLWVQRAVARLGLYEGPMEFPDRSRLAPEAI
jgi:uncharacterized membrane protein YdfJ with MMPL/SSD domain